MNPTPLSRLPRYSVVILLFVIFLVGFFTYKDYGETFDNRYAMFYGQYLLHFLKTGERTFETVKELQLIRFYGPVGDTLSAIFIEPFQPLPYGRAAELRHLFIFLFGFIGLISVYASVKSALGRGAGIIAVALLALLPRLYGHSFNNPKDLFFGALYMLSLWGVFYYIQKKNTGRLILSAFITGICMDQRIGAIFIFPVFFMALVYSNWREGLFSERGLAGSIIDLARSSTIFTLVTAVTVYIFFPFLWPDPVTRFTDVFKLMSAFPDVTSTFFMGEYVDTTRLPRSYIPLLLHVTIPVGTIIFIYLGVILTLIRFFKKTLSKNEEYLFLISITAIILPVMAVIVNRSPLYDGIRHFLFVSYPLIILATFGLILTCRALKGGRLALVFGGTVTLYYAFVAFTMITIHPYQAVYFSELTGGLKGGAKYFETDYWGSSYKEGFNWLNSHTTGKVKVTTGSYFNSIQYLRDGMELDDADPDFYISTTRYGEHNAVSSEAVHIVSRHDTPLLYIKPVKPEALKLLTVAVE